VVSFSAVPFVASQGYQVRWYGVDGAGNASAPQSASFVHDPLLPLDPVQVTARAQRAIRVLFDRFAVEPSAWAVVRWARKTGYSVPTRRWYSDGSSDLKWKHLGRSRLYEVLRNPIYAGVYVYGRRPSRKQLVNGEIRLVRDPGRDPAKWPVRIDGAHPAYLSWEAFVRNQEKLRQNHATRGGLRQGPPREGEGLLTGLLVCGRCGHRMNTGYGSSRKGRWYYQCPGKSRDKGENICWSAAGPILDEAVEKLFLETMVPSELDLSLAVDREVDKQAEALDQQWRSRLEQAGYEARRAGRRYKAVDPENRVVARTLEREWEERLGELEEIERQHTRAKREQRVELSEEDRARIRAIAKELPRVWKASTTSKADRKAMLRLVIEAIALSPLDVPRRATRVRVEWKSGAVSELEVARPGRRDVRRPPPEVLQRIRQLAADGMRDEQIAERLNAEKAVTGTGLPWNDWRVRWARARDGIERTAPDLPRRPRLPDRHEDGRYSTAGAAKLFGVSVGIVRSWIERGLVKARKDVWRMHRNTWWSGCCPGSPTASG